MFKLDPIRRGMPTYATTPYNRGVALALGIVNIPVMIGGTVFTFVGWFFPIILFVPAAVLFGGYWKIYHDKLEIRQVIQVWRWTVIYNMLMSILYIGFLISMPYVLAGILLFQAWMVFMATSAYKELKKKHGPEYFEEKIEDWGYDIEYIDHDEEEDSRNPREAESLAYKYNIGYSSIL